MSAEVVKIIGTEEEAKEVLDVMSGAVALNTLSPDEIIDIVEQRILGIGGEVQGKGEVLKDFPVIHRFTPGLYIREITMFAGSVLTSKIHKTEHPFVVSKGRCLVYLNKDDGWQEIAAPYTGVTQPNTRRVLVILEDTVWTTFHPTNLTDIIEIEESLLESHDNPLIPEGAKKPLIEAEIKE